MARRGRPPLPDPDAIAAFVRFSLLCEAGAGVTAAETAMLEEPRWQALTCRQAVRKRRAKGEALALLALFHPLNMPEFSYKTGRE